MNKKKVLIIGAGPGGLSAGMQLAHRGYDVEIYEKNSEVGGRNAQLRLGEYKFDTGPTFFMMKYILDEIFEETGRKSEDYIDFVKLSPMYKLLYGDGREMKIYDEPEKMRKEIARAFPGEEDGLDTFYEKEKNRFEKLMPILQENNNCYFDALKPKFLKALPHLALGRNLYDVMGDYFDSEELRLSFTFQSKYLGMSPWKCPGAFGLIPFVEHEFGIYHAQGNLAQVCSGMEKVFKEEDGKIHFNKNVQNVIVENGKAVGIRVDDEEVRSDEVIVNADFGYAAQNLFEDGVIKKYKKKSLDQKKLSCSIFMMYLGVKKQYDHLEHHTIAFAKEYRKNVEDIFEGRLTDKDFSLYVRDATKTDPSLAPEGKSALYVLVPVPNTRADIDWKEKELIVREQTLNLLEERFGLEGIRDEIEEERIITPDEWENEYNVFEGAVFNLAHNLRQMLWFRPHNAFEEVKNCYLVGGGTHPGSGLPTIYESGRIAVNLIDKKYKN